MEQPTTAGAWLSAAFLVHLAVSISMHSAVIPTHRTALDGEGARSTAARFTFSPSCIHKVAAGSTFAKKPGFPEEAQLFCGQKGTISSLAVIATLQTEKGERCKRFPASLGQMS